MSFPFYGEKFIFTQPDGTVLKVKGWGDQHYAVFETEDGYTIVKDPITGFFHYAKVSGDKEELLPTGVRPEILKADNLGLDAHARIHRDAAKATAEAGSGLMRTKSRWQVRRDRQRMTLKTASLAPGIVAAPPQQETVGKFVGLCLLIDFPDVPATISREEVSDFCNLEGYNGFGNNGSVHDYFLDNSLGKLKYTNIVAPYYTAKYSRAYYTNEAIPMPNRAYELIKEALDHLIAGGFDFEPLTSDDENYVYALNVFYAGTRVNNWAQGLWPHSYHLLVPYQLAPGKMAFDYQFTDMGSELTLATFCHENGHMICDFPDLYDYGYESRGVGSYCLMCSGGSVDRKNPTNICAYLKYKAGWSQKLTQISDSMTGEALADKNEFFIHRKDATEYYIIENRHRAKRDQSLPDSGLAIWHIDELGSNNNELMTPTSHYECSLVQADGKNDLEHNVNGGDNGDLFDGGDNDQFNSNTNPSSKWWDGTSSGLSLAKIDRDGEKVVFSAEVKEVS